MKEYIITVAVAAVVASCADVLAPKEWKSYIKVAIGFLLLSVLLAPVTKFRHVQIFAPSPEYEISSETLFDEVSKELKNNIEKDIEERILAEFGLKVKAKAEIEIDSEHNIKGVKAIEIKGWTEPEGLKKRLKEVYGCERIVFKFE